MIAGPILSSVNGSGFVDPFVNSKKPKVIISLGSSGDQNLTPKIVEILKSLPINLYVSMSGTDLGHLKNSDTVFISEFLPLEILLNQAQLLVCNGGSASGYLSLSCGVPFLAIPSNIDQFNFTDLICKKGAAIKLRAHQINPSKLIAAAQTILTSPSYAKAAQDLGTKIRQENASETFNKLTDSILQGVDK